MNSTMNGTYIIPSTNRTVNPKLVNKTRVHGNDINQDSSTPSKPRKKSKATSVGNSNTDTSQDDNNSYGSKINGYLHENKTKILSELLDKIKDLIMLLAAK
uniref:Neogenin_C domain-containing protein n=1 Tax=Parastrongyloides trichosuri TaxID=131310 RepID=A0A0N4ZJE1_PARTI